MPRNQTPARQGPAEVPAPMPARPQPVTRELSTFLEGQSERIAKALPKHLTPERMIQVVTQIVHRNNKLQQCHPASILAAVIQASTLGLDLAPSLGEAYLIPRKNRDGTMECHFQPGYRGLAKLVRNAGGCVYIKAMLVHDRDHFLLRYTPDLEFNHTPYFGADRGYVTHAYAVAKLPSGEFLIEVMDIEELELIHRRSEGYKNAQRFNQAETGPWVEDRGEMCKKSVIKRLAKSLPMSSELADAVDADNAEYEVPGSPGEVTARVAPRRGLAGLSSRLQIEEPALPTQGTRTYQEAEDEGQEAQEAARDDEPGADEEREAGEKWEQGRE